MSDDEADPELLALLAQSRYLNPPKPSTGVLRSAEYITDNAISVSITSSGTKGAARTIYQLMQSAQFSTSTWSTHELHPKNKDEGTVEFIFTVNLSNFCFWSDKSAEDRFCVEYRGKRWTGYWSLVAALQRALDEGIPITEPHFWQDESESTEELFRHVFRSATSEEIPLFTERIACFREAGRVLYKYFGCKFSNCIAEANGSAVALVNLVVDYFPCFRDEAVFHGERVNFYKRAQILVGDLWACFNGESFGLFDDIDSISMFADYRIPQMLESLGCLWYSPQLKYRIKRLDHFRPGEDAEIELRGCSIWCVELLRREIVKAHPETKVNAILIDFFLYDTLKEKESNGEEAEMLPHHRTRSIWY